MQSVSGESLPHLCQVPHDDYRRELTHCHEPLWGFIYFCDLPGHFKVGSLSYMSYNRWFELWNELPE